MRIEEGEWPRLAALRERFLAEGGRGADYWTDARLCELYDATFGRRIAWKWRAVLGELAARERLPRAQSVLDWGAGTGIAAREFVRATRARGPAERGPVERVPVPERVYLFDRSRIATEHGALELRALAPDASTLHVEAGPSVPDEPVDLLLASHVLGELDHAGRAALFEAARRARAVILVEPGERRVSRELGRLRDELLAAGAGERVVLGPCTHAAACPLLSADRERDWCHFFAAPEPEAFTRPEWREFSERLSIDLRSAPYSWIALGPRDAAVASAPDAKLEIRILGRPRLEKGHAKIDACDASGVRVLRVFERDLKPFVKQLAEPTRLTRPFRVTLEGDRVRSIE